MTVDLREECPQRLQLSALRHYLRRHTGEYLEWWLKRTAAEGICPLPCYEEVFTSAMHSLDEAEGEAEAWRLLTEVVKMVIAEKEKETKCVK